MKFSLRPVLLFALISSLCPSLFATVKFSTENLSDEQIAKVRAAIREMNELIWDDKVVQCVIDNARKTMWFGDAKPHVYPNKKEAEGGIGMLLVGIENYGLTRGSLSYSIKITGKSLPKSTNGSAQLKVTKRADESPEGRSRYTITLNKDTIMKRSESGLAGTIFHEMLHNIGMDHPSTGNYKVDYEAHMIKEYGLCIAGKGVAAFGLTADDYSYGAE